MLGSGKYVGGDGRVAQLLLKIDRVIVGQYGRNARGAAMASAHAGMKRSQAESFKALSTAQKFDFVSFVAAGRAGNLRRNDHGGLRGASRTSRTLVIKLRPITVGRK